MSSPPYDYLPKPQFTLDMPVDPNVPGVSAKKAPHGGVLHVYGAYEQHEDVHVYGTKDALRGLRDALTRALNNMRPEFAMTEAADGEGYVVVVIPLADMSDATLPYVTMRGYDGKFPMLKHDDFDRYLAFVGGPKCHPRQGEIAP